MAKRTQRRRRYYRKVPIEHVVPYAETLLNQIKMRLGHVVSFTREDLLQLPVAEFSQVATITRYRETCVAVAYLIESGELVQKKFPDLCLRARADLYRFDETTVASEYEPTIRQLVRTMPAAKPFAVLHVVKRWRTDPQLTTDTKRKAVRMLMSRLIREGVCRRASEFEFTTGGAS